MREQRYEVAGDPVCIKTIEHEDDLPGFRDFVRSNLRRLVVDTEATGTNMYEPGFRLRTVQFGNDKEAWVVPVELGGRFVEDTIRALRGLQEIVIHNAGFDVLVIDRKLGITAEELWPKVTDTMLYAKLIDPRPVEKGGMGASLEDLTRGLIDARIADEVKGLMAKLAKEHKTTKSKIWPIIDLFHPEFQLYAGMDCILAARILAKLLGWMYESGKKLITYEHKLAEVCSYYQRTGFLLDVEYTEALSERLGREQEMWSEKAAELGVENVNSTDQVANGLLSMGVRLNGRTPSGKIKVDKKVLDDLIKKENPLAIAVKEAKKAGKWKTTWVDTFLATRDEHDRCHASINTLQARTGRMSITGIPAQTLPSGDWMIRRCFISDPGQVMCSVDYMAQELRVLAALSGDEVMIEAFKNNADLHLLTARAAFGDHIMKDSPERKYAKVVNFGRVYGGGANTVAEQTGLDIKTAKQVVAGFDTAYPGVKRYSNKLQQLAMRQGYIETPFGRRLPVDKDRPYSALNYMVQSSSRDVTGRGIIQLHKAGFTPYMRLPIHDETLSSIPAAKAEWGAQEIARHMAMDMGPVWIGTEPEVGARSWGSLYGADY